MQRRFMRLEYFVLALVSALVVSSCGKDDKGGNKSPETMPAITDLSTIEQAADRGTMVGRNVSLDNVRVDRVVGNYVFWAGGANGIPVFRNDRLKGTSKEHVQPNGKVRIAGTVRLVSSLPVTDPFWDHINAAEKADIESARVFIFSDNVQVIH